MGKTDTTGMPYIILIVYLAFALLFQFLLGDFPTVIFAFPLNVLLLLLWAVIVAVLWKSGKKSGFVRFMLSSGATYWALGIFLVLCLAVGISGYRWLTGTWPFVAFMLYFQTVLSYVILRGWRKPTATGARLGAVRWRFLFLHVGLLVAVASAYWGAPDTETLKLQAFKGVPVTEAYRQDGRTAWLDYTLTLSDFTVQYGADGMPSDYKAVVAINDESVELRVNHPYSITLGESLYLSGYDVSEGYYCVLQVVREPWHYGILTGIVILLLGALLLFVGGPRCRNNDIY